MRSKLSFAIVFAGVALAGCGDRTSPLSAEDFEGAGSDGGLDASKDVGRDGGGDAIVFDSGRDSTFDAVRETEGDFGPPDFGVDLGVDTGPVGLTLIASGNYFMLDTNSITTDGYIAALNADTNMLQAIPLAGGAPIDIVSRGQYAFATADVLLVYSNVSFSTNVGTVGVWTKSNGYHELSTSADFGFFGGGAGVSTDGSVVAFTNGAAGTGGLVNVMVTDRTGGVTTRVVAYATRSTTCAPTFAGVKGGVAVSACDATTGTSAKISIFDAKGTAIDLVPLFKPSILTSDVAGDTILAVDGSGAVAPYTSGGSPLAFLSTTGITASLTRDGKALWTSFTSPSDAAGPLYSGDPTAVASSKKIADARVVRIDPVFYGSPRTSRYAVYATTFDPTTFESDLNYVAIDGSAAPVAVSTDPGSAIFGDATTFDDAFALFLTNVSSGAGDLHVFDLSTRATSVVANNVWLVFSPKGHVVAYDDNWNAGGNGNEGVADIRLLSDVGGKPTLVATQAENNFYLTLDFKQIVFASSDPSIGKHGVYLATVP